MNQPLISIIVPCYNQSQYLDECLQSVLDQTYPDWECIIVNDGSPDNTEEVARKWVEKDVRFKYFYKENGGLSSARNFGILKSEGVFVFFIDADDHLPNFNVFGVFESYLIRGNYDVVVGNVIERHKDNSLYESNFNSKITGVCTLREGSILPAFVNRVFSMIACAKFYRRNFIISNSILFKDNILHEDELFMFHIAAVAENIVLVPVICYEYNRTNTSSITSNITLQNKDDAVFIIKEHYKIIKTFDLLTKYGDSLLNVRIRYLATVILNGNMLLSQKKLWKAYYGNLRNDYRSSDCHDLKGCFPHSPEISYFLMRYKFWAEYKNNGSVFKKISSHIIVI